MIKRIGLGGKCVIASVIVFLLVNIYLSFDESLFDFRSKKFSKFQGPSKYLLAENPEANILLQPIFTALDRYTARLEASVVHLCLEQAKSKRLKNFNHCIKYVSDAEKFRTNSALQIRDSIVNGSFGLCNASLELQFEQVLQASEEKCALRIHDRGPKTTAVSDSVEKECGVRHEAQNLRKGGEQVVHLRDPVDTADVSLGNPPKRENVLILSGSDMKPSGDPQWTFLQQALDQRDAYAKYYGMRHKFINFTKFDPGKDHIEHPSYLKLPAFQEAFARYPDVEWIWWMDTSIVLVNGSFNLIDNVLHPKALEKYFMYNLPINNMGDNYYSGVRMPSHGGVDFKKLQFIFTHDNQTLNTGSFFIRRSAITQLILEMWGNRRLRFKDEHNNELKSRFLHHDQDAFIDMMINHKIVKDVVGVVPLGLFNSYYTSTYRRGDFLAHFTGVSSYGTTLKHWVPFYKQFQLPDSSYQHILLAKETKHEAEAND